MSRGSTAVIIPFPSRGSTADNSRGSTGGFAENQKNPLEPTKPEFSAEFSAEFGAHYTIVSSAEYDPEAVISWLRNPKFTSPVVDGASLDLTPHGLYDGGIARDQSRLLGNFHAAVEPPFPAE